MKVAVLADIHANLPALEMVLMEVEGMPKFCCGDLLGYNPFPNEVIDRIKKENLISVLGNHDSAILTGDTYWFNKTATRAIEWSIKELTEENLDYLKTLAQIYDSEFYMTHGSPKNPLEAYIRPEDPDYVFEDLFNYTKNNAIALGHTHIPFIKSVGEKRVFNPGSVGQPRDLDNRASYATFDTETGEVEINRVEYDIEKTARKIVDVGLPERLAIRLLRGI